MLYHHCFSAIALEYDIRKFQGNEEGQKINGTHQLLICADNVNLPGDKTTNNSMALSASELYRPNDHRLSANLVPTLADRGRHGAGIPTIVTKISSPEPLPFLPNNSSVLLTMLSRPCSHKIWQRRESNPVLWICNQ
jgi:hypothetical protein